MPLQEYLSGNKNRVFPFKENSDLGELPSWMLLDLRLVNADYTTSLANSVLKCASFEKNGSSVTLAFSYTNGDKIVPFTVPVALGSDIMIGTIDINALMKCQFAVYGGGSEYTLDVADGTYEVGATVLESRVIEIGANRKLCSLGGSTGVVHVVDGYNTSAKIVGNEIQITAGTGTGLGSKCVGEDDDDAFSCKKALLFINGQHADSSGNFNIEGGPGISVQIGRTAVVDGDIVPAITIKISDKVKELY